ncbi:hypothetical protein [Labrys sp. ZIDIC5]|uniref:hypothetical protein n=1 Tax=Labrys sedimenti TaxID=3106036 RepID=UPI002ACA126F|nr:hypothetical protein [Labrys sp. ZIDIC5]MDZ5452322.1 hypothetical protein [Labrys sp. ZIDIC5]
MVFIVNGADWDFNELTVGEAEELIDCALEFIEASSERGEEVAIGDDFQTRPMHGASTLWDLFSQTSPLPIRRELSQELAAWLNRAPCYADTEQWPNGFDDVVISIADAAPAANEDVAWVHYSIRAGTPAATFTLGNAGVFATTTATGSADVHFVANNTHRKQFWRDMIVLEGDNLESLLRYSSRAYPELYFVDGVIEGAGHLAGGYLASRQRVRDALATLDDWGYWVFTCPPPTIAPGEEPPPDPGASPTNQLIERRFGGLNLNAAPENTNVRNHRASREARETVLKTRTLYCEWHVKLQLHQNRIHFHPPVPESGNKIVIGMIHEHLPLPT